MTANGSDDGVRISEGGVVSIDTTSLRDAASGLAPLAAGCAELAADMAAVRAVMNDLTAPASIPRESAHRLTRRLDDAAGDADELVRGLRDTADVFEIVELDAERAAAVLAGDDGAAAVLSVRLALARALTPDAARAADLLRDAAPSSHISGVWAQFAPAATMLGPWALPALSLAAGAMAIVGATGLGGVRGDTALTGSRMPVRVSEWTHPPIAPPPTLESLAARMPQGDDQIRVERYAQPDGGSRFVVYVAGTEEPVGFGGVEPWDMASNLDLYTGQRSVSYDAVVEALHRAGAGTGDAVIAVGHSQGAAITSHLAMSGEFRVEANVMFGSPVAADLPAGVLDVNVRHTDDLVPLLQTGGHATQVGAPGSFIAERSTGALGGGPGVSIAAHDMTHYVETAALVDASNDPRVDGIRTLLDELGDNGPAQVTTYHARRVDPPAETP